VATAGGRTNSAFVMAKLLLIALALLATRSHALPAPPSEIEASATIEESRRLQTAAAPPPPKAKVSLWSAAKRFFTSREKQKAKLHPVASSGTTTPPTAPIMSAKYGVSYKEMVGWWCAKAENAQKSLCKLHAAGKTPSSPATLTHPSLTESKDAYKAYCADESHKAKLICIQSKIQAKLATTTTALAKSAKKAGAAKASIPAAA